MTSSSVRTPYTSTMCIWSRTVICILRYHILEEEFAKKFSGEDSVIIFEVNKVRSHKYGNAIHRDQDVVYF